MEITEAKQQFVNTWGALGTQWGINKTMAQMHALLLVQTEALTQDEIMETLQISRGNVNMNVRELVSWGLVQRQTKRGERKEYFIAEKDMWKVATLIISERKKRELDPIIKLIGQLQDVENTGNAEEIKAFKKMIKDIQKLGSQADKILHTITKAEENWVGSKLMKLIK